jgi:hypothetical protein
LSLKQKRQMKITKKKMKYVRCALLRTNRITVFSRK